MDQPAEDLPRRPEGSHAPFEDCLQLDAVGLVYPGGARVLCAVDLTIEAGAKIAIVGKTGAGKTSLVNLILGFVEPSEGRILYDGKAGRPLARLRCSATAYVQQEPFLLDTTVLENIAFAAKAESIDEAKVWEALRRARIDDMVRSLPEGLGTRLGENGIRFSGGERQRIALARAFYRQPLFLVLDEATSQLDTATEHDIIDDLLHHRPDMTVLMVTHRPAVARQFHRVLCVESRAVAEWAQSAELADAVPLGRNDAI